jgi:uncharacterized membrane protein
MGKSKAKTGASQATPQKIAKQDEKILPWTSITRKQADQFVQLTTTGAWAGIGLLILLWITVHFLGPALGLWTLAGTQ